MKTKILKRHLWCNGLRAYLECSRSRGFQPRSGQTLYNAISIGCLSAKQTALRENGKDMLVRNQDNVYGLSDMSSRALLYH